MFNLPYLRWIYVKCRFLSSRSKWALHWLKDKFRSLHATQNKDHIQDWQKQTKRIPQNCSNRNVGIRNDTMECKPEDGEWWKSKPIKEHFWQIFWHFDCSPRSPFLEKWFSNPEIEFLTTYFNNQSKWKFWNFCEFLQYVFQTYLFWRLFFFN